MLQPISWSCPICYLCVILVSGTCKSYLGYLEYYFNNELNKLRVDSFVSLFSDSRAWAIASKSWKCSPKLAVLTQNYPVFSFHANLLLWQDAGAWCDGGCLWQHSTLRRGPLDGVNCYMRRLRRDVPQLIWGMERNQPEQIYHRICNRRNDKRYWREQDRKIRQNC